MGAEILLSLLLTAPAAAHDCVAALERALRGKPRALARCLQDTAPVERLLSEKPAFEERGLRVVRASSPTVIAGAYGTGTFGFRRHYLFAADGEPPWASLRVYRAARPWPAPPEPAEPQQESALWGMAEAFNARFGKGDVKGWMRFWRPDALFVSVVGPFQGPEVRVFFEKQAERYLEPRMEIHRALMEPGQALTEGVISGRCRGTGASFELPFIMVTRQRGGKAAFVYEGFTVDSDGCGTFWTLPR